MLKRPPYFLFTSDLIPRREMHAAAALGRRMPAVVHLKLNVFAHAQTKCLYAVALKSCERREEEKIYKT